MYVTLGEEGLSAESCAQAYELREKVSEPERLYIESHYYQFTTGELERQGISITSYGGRPIRAITRPTWKLE